MDPAGSRIRRIHGFMSPTGLGFGKILNSMVQPLLRAQQIFIRWFDAPCSTINYISTWLLFELIIARMRRKDRYLRVAKWTWMDGLVPFELGLVEEYELAWCLTFLSNFPCCFMLFQSLFSFWNFAILLASLFLPSSNSWYVLFWGWYRAFSFVFLIPLCLFLSLSSLFFSLGFASLIYSERRWAVYPSFLTSTLHRT